MEVEGGRLEEEVDIVRCERLQVNGYNQGEFNASMGCSSGQLVAEHGLLSPMTSQPTCMIERNISVVNFLLAWSLRVAQSDSAEFRAGGPIRVKCTRRVKFLAESEPGIGTQGSRGLKRVALFHSKRTPSKKKRKKKEIDRVSN